MKNNIKLLLIFAALGLQTTNSYGIGAVMEEYSEMNEKQLDQARTEAQDELTKAQEELTAAEEANVEATAKSQAEAQQAVSNAQAKLLEIATAMDTLADSFGDIGADGGVPVDFDPIETEVVGDGMEDIGEDGLTDSERGWPEVTTPPVAEAVPATSAEIAGLPEATATAITEVAESFAEGVTQETIDNGVNTVINAEGKPLTKIQAFFDMLGKGFAGLFEMIGDAFSKIFSKSSSSSISESSSSSSATQKTFAEIDSLTDDQIQNLKDATVTTAAEAQSFFNLEDGYTEEDLENARYDDSLTKASFQSLVYDQDSSIQENIAAAYDLLVEDAIPEGQTWVEVDDDESIDDEDETPTAPAQPESGKWGF